MKRLKDTLATTSMRISDWFSDKIVRAFEKSYLFRCIKSRAEYASVMADLPVSLKTCWLELRTGNECDITLRELKDILKECLKHKFIGGNRKDVVKAAMFNAKLYDRRRLSSYAYIGDFDIDAMSAEFYDTVVPKVLELLSAENSPKSRKAIDDWCMSIRKD